MTKKGINTPVEVTALRFGKNMARYPRRMEWKGRIYNFVDNGIRTTIRDGSSVSYTMTMSDGESTFCLRERAGSWTLLSVLA